MEQPFIDLIYESAFAPELWPKVLEGLAQTAEARGGVLFVANPASGFMRWTASEGFKEIFDRFVSEGWAQRDQRSARILAGRHAGFATDHDLFTEQELEDDELLPFKRSQGLGYGAGIAAALPTADLLGIGILRAYGQPPVERELVARLDELRPHLARSSFISARLQLERAHAAAEMLNVLGVPAVLLAGNGKAIAANRLIESLKDIVQWNARDRVALVDQSADASLKAALRALGAESLPAALSLAIRGRETSAAMVAHLVPVRGATAREIFSQCVGVLVLTPATAPQAPPIELVQSLFDLTAAEARVARGLAAGSTLDDIAVANGVSRNTVRSQLRGALEKTGCGRQAELVALLGGIMPRFVDPKS